MPGSQMSSQKLRVVAPALSALFAEIRNAGTSIRRLRELIVTAETAVAAGGALGLYRATNIPAGGVVQASQALEYNAPVSTMQSISSGWTTPPTVGVIPIDGTWMPSVIGGQAAMIWIPGEELTLAPAGLVSCSLVLKAETALPALTIKFKATDS